MKFDVYGPFSIPRERGAIDDIQNFWDRVDRIDGLAYAVGCYVFAVKPSGPHSTPIPYYVGKTERSFYQEVFTNHKLRIYNRVLRNRQRARPLLFFIPKLTRTGKFSTAGARPINALEKILIAQSIAVNPECENRSGTRMVRKIEVIGFRNTKRRAKGGPSKRLRETFGLR